MEVDPQPLRGMDVELGNGLGDEFEVFDDLFAPSTNNSDFLIFCALDEQAQQDAAAVATAPPSPGSSGASSSAFGQVGHVLSQDDRNHTNQHEHSRDRENYTITNKALIASSLSLSHGGMRGKPRARKRHDEDEALEPRDSTYPILKQRRSSTAFIPTKTEDTTGGLGVDLRFTAPEKLSDKCHSFDVQASASWTQLPRAPASFSRGQGGQQQRLGGVGGISTPMVQSAAALPPSPILGPAGGAIKVKKDLTSSQTRPRISVFMSATASRDGGRQKSFANTKPPLCLSSPLQRFPSASMPQHQHIPNHIINGGTPNVTTPFVGNLQRSSSALTMRHSSSPQQRIQAIQHQDLTTLHVRPRSQAEQRLVDTNPAVVAMGSCRKSSTAVPLNIGSVGSSLDDGFARPTLHRATSIGALKITGSGDVFSRSPVLSSSGSIIKSCELSEQVGGAGQRRNLVCKVFGSGGSFGQP